MKNEDKFKNENKQGLQCQTPLWSYLLSLDLGSWVSILRKVNDHILDGVLPSLGW